MSALTSPPFLRSAIHLSTHAFMRRLDTSLPTLTVGTTLSIRSAMTNMASSRKLLCSLYGTPKHMASRVLPRWGVMSDTRNRDAHVCECRIDDVGIVDGGVLALAVIAGPLLVPA